MKKELHKLNPSLGLLDKGGCLQEDRWKQFKVDYNVTRASMRISLEAPGEDYFVAAKAVYNKNKAIEELLPNAKQFFKAFLSQKADFVKPVGRAYFRAFDATNNWMGTWPANSWELTSENLKLAMLDFRRVPGFVAKESSTFQDPYFQQFMLMFMQSNCPNINEPPNRLWICSDKETKLAIHNLSGHSMLTAKYVRKFSTYIPAKFERLEDLPATHRNVQAPISLMFLIRHVDKDRISILEEFAAPNTFVYTKPRKYQELEYRDQPSELRMEFYLQLLDLFCCRGNTIYSVFSGTKILCARLVSHALPGSDTHSDQSSFNVA